MDADGRGKEAKGSGLLELKGEAFTGLPGWTREGEEDLGAPSARKQCRPCQGCLHSPGKASGLPQSRESYSELFGLGEKRVRGRRAHTLNKSIVAFTVRG